MAPKAAEANATESINTPARDYHATAGPSKRMQEFMDVMKGADSTPTASTSASTAVPGEDGWVADGEQKKRKEKIKKREGKAEEIEENEAVKDHGEDDDVAWLRRRQAASNGDVSQTADDKPSVSQSAREVHTMLTLQADDELILSTRRLFIRNLAFITTSTDLSSHFSTFGPIEEVHLPVSQQTGQPLGTAFVLFRDPQHALEAFRKLDKTTFQGRLLHVLPGRAKPGQERSGGDGVVDGQVLGKARETRGEVKKGAETRRKEESSKGVNWATMYMNVSGTCRSLRLSC